MPTISMIYMVAAGNMLDGRQNILIIPTTNIALKKGASTRPIP
jgi:hypothetical protein